MLLTGGFSKGPPFELFTFWPCGPSFPCILAFWALMSFHFGLLGLHFLIFWPFGLSFPCILAFWAPFLFILAFWAFISFHFGLLGLQGGILLLFVAFYGFRGGILLLFVAVWALRGGILLLFVAFWGFRGGILHNFGPPLVGSPPQAAKNGPFSNAPIQRIYQRRGQVNFLIFGLVDVDFLHFGFAGFHFLLFCLSGLHFIAFGPLILPLGL